METYENARLKTKNKIKQGFWELYEKYEIEKITVGQIAQVSNIHRATFYTYYHDIYEVLEEIEKELIDSLDQYQVDKLMEVDDPIRSFVEMIAKEYNDHRQYLHLLLLDQKHPEFGRKYSLKFYSLFPIDIEWINNDKIKQIIDVVVYGLGSVLAYLIDRNTLSTQEIADVLYGFIMKGIGPTFIEMITNNQ